MRPAVTALLLALLVFAGPVALAAQAPGAAPAQPRPPQRRGPAPVMALSTPAWTDGGTIPLKHSQAGEEVSPALAWDQVPDGTESFVLVVHDADSALAGGTDTVLHWLVWNIPGTARGLREAQIAGPQLPDGSRQISVSGPYYRGPGAAATDPPHHYVFELYALDTKLDVPAVGQSPAETRARVLAAMAGHVRGKAALVGTFTRPAP